MAWGLGLGLALGGNAAASASLPTLAFANAVSQAEGASGTTVFTFTLQLTRNGSTAAIPFIWSVTGSGTNPADATDFVGGVLPSGNGVFAAGETSKTIAVNVAGDSAVEPDEGFTISAQGTIAFAATAAGTILNDDVAPVTTMVAASRLFGPGASNGAPVLTGDGTAKSYTVTLTNDTGRAITTAALLLSGRGLTTTGSTAAGNDFAVSGTIEYPNGTTTAIAQGGSASVTVPGTAGAGLYGQNLVQTDAVALATAIPAGASYKVNLTSTVASGAKYIVQLGLVNVLAQLATNSLPAVRFVSIGDSINTNNGGAVHTAALGRAPGCTLSISGTAASAYAAATANFAWQLAVAQAIGATDVISHFSTNDAQAGRTVAQIVADLGTLRDATRGVRMRFNQATMLPRVSLTIVTSSGVTSSGTTMTLAVASAALFDVGRPYTVAGAAQPEYNGNFLCTAVDTAANTITLRFPGSATSPATGTITVKAFAGVTSRKLQAPLTAAYAAGSGSVRGQVNAYIRGSNFDGMLEWGDPFEKVRDDGVMVTYEDRAELDDPFTATVVAKPSGYTDPTAAAFYTTVPVSVYMALGFGQFTSGANLGQSRAANTNNSNPSYGGGSFGVGTAYGSAPVAGDTLDMVPGTATASTDGTHPGQTFVTNGNPSRRGAQVLLEKAVDVWLTNRGA